MSPDESQRVLSTLAAIRVTQSVHGELLHKLDHAVNGNGQPGLKLTVAKHDAFIKNAIKAGWIVLTPILAAAGGGIIYLIAIKH